MERPLITRRKFVATSSLACAGITFAKISPSSAEVASKSPILDPSTLAPFVDQLPIPPVLKPLATRPDPDDPKQSIPFYQLSIAESAMKVHRDLPPASMWTIGGSFPGPTLETQVSHGFMVEWQNRLPARHIFAIDHSLHGAGKDIPDVRAVIHLHGGRTPAASDGYPEEWKLTGQSQIAHYPSMQEAATLFYHDHTMGINRLNTYAGMMGFCILRDPQENQFGLPSGKYDIPLLICDRILRTDGQLDYPVSQKPGEVWVPEVFGEAILTNGKLLPYLDVEPATYRFRILNGSNGRFFRFSLVNKATFHQIASDQGLLAAPVPLKRIVMAPAERAEILIDFQPMAGQQVELVSDSFSVLRFRVAPSVRTQPAPLSVPTTLKPLERLPESKAIKTRRLTLDERMDDVQRSMGMLLNNTPWHAPVTENPVQNSTEIWELVNLTDDSHPIHLHLVRFQLLDRRRLDTFEFQSTGKIRYTGPAQLPAPEEAGWKDTVRADPGMVTRIIIPFERYAGRYVWHCHILEHEDNEMMRPYEVLPAGDATL